MYIPFPMRSTPSLMSLGVAVIAATLSGQPQTDKPPLPKGQMPDLRIKHAMRLLSPFNYKVATTLSVDGGPFRNYGNPWWRKDAAGSK
ncbi:MAG: hypothetical protein DMF94_00195 [Acidobacteria bacterium]|nr:MAG: hypothetical protein DMF94_00195 [Acidobacteriota bacterium]